MERRLPYALLLLTATLGGCGRSPEGAAVAPTPLPATLAGVYSGELPCSNCAAIAATLWLRPDGRFVLRQRFTDVGDSAGAGSATYALGRWHWDETAAEAVLRSPGPERRLKPLDADRLRLHAASPIEHVLARDTGAGEFSDRLTLDGESAVTKQGATFTECLTGLSFTVAESGAYRELRRQHARMNPRGKVALTTVEGHLVTAQHGAATTEQLVVDRFIAIKPGKGC
jgi:hypothetical protein